MQLNRTTANVEKRPIKVLQFGEGNFLRAFIDWMIHEMNVKADFNAGVAVVQPIPQGLGELLSSQDGLYHLYLNGIEKGQLINKKMLVDCIQSVVNPYEDYNAYLQLAEEEELKFVFSNTTEAGITYKAGDAKDKVQDSFPAKLTAFLNHRFEHFKGDASKGLIILPCELIDKNGVKLKEIILKYAADWGLSDDFKTWLDSACTFYNTLVDRIVPGYPKDRIKEIHEELGFEDQLVVEGEQFHLMVMEGDQSIKEVLPFEKAGLNIIVTDNQAPYRTRKVRILNGAHTLMVPVGLLAGIETVRENVENEQVGKFVDDAVTLEVIPSLPSAEGLVEFKEDVMDRFRNPFIQHYLKSIALNSFPKFNTRVLPSITSFIEKEGKVPSHLLMSFAALIKLYDPKNPVGFKPQDNQDVVELLSTVWEEYRSEYFSIDQLVEKVLAYKNVWGQDLNQLPLLKEELSVYLRVIDADGGVHSYFSENVINS
ncbi:tagaturonate reductase [Flammeovirga yaeyamensis]|uniref:Tagaturonate reductase n=1 Tax=Flammeovirga yaeyamensis TaxID=367791 RepID=A0AAX1N9R3_9BACT|nr:tagaturonate reductase [Flammeovirga yaeyamensis]MBB3699404.1 tagaturonate reductase [Flammeovirga yaeyamensis]NMF35337.1 tagaturonate reductase [Flammeovirga yaeyamensis]QWG04197.1 tagaturonate reductase [Flammeovirga yaeyamensis]